jgi:ankyrin repeat protein
MFLSDKLMPAPFETAVQENNTKLVHDLLSGARPLPIDIRNEASQSGLMIACAHRNVETAKELLVKYGELEPNLIDGSDALGWTALHHAAQSGSFECVQLLIEHNSDIDATTSKNETALFLATKHHHVDIVELLTDNKCQLQTKAMNKYKQIWGPDYEMSSTALDCAATDNCAEAARCLLLHLARTKELSQKEFNLLLTGAALNGHTEIAKELILYGPHVNLDEGTISNLSDFSFFGIC